MVLDVDLCFFFIFVPPPFLLKSLGCLWTCFCFIFVDCIKLLISCSHDSLRFYKGFDFVSIQVFADI